MQAVIHDRHGEPADVLRCVEAPTPAAQRGQAVVAMEAAVIHPADLLTIQGRYAAHPRFPGATPGNEGVGRIVDVGEDVTLAVGTRVLLPMGSGTWRDHVVVTASQLVPAPDDVPADQLAMASINPLTASLLLSSILELRPGEWVIQNAANSAVGQLVARLARARGLRTVNIVRRAAAERTVHAAGGHVVVMAGDDLAATVQRYTNGDQIRLALDAVGGSHTGRIAQCLTLGGTVVNYGALAGKPCAISPDLTIFRDIRLRGFWLSHWLQRTPTQARQQALTDLLPLVADGTLEVPVQATYRLDQIHEAVAHAAQPGRSGKVILRGAAHVL